MADTIDPRFIDKRTAERYMRTGQLDEKVYEKHLKSLPDLDDDALPVVTVMDEDELFDEDDDELDEADAQA